MNLLSLIHIFHAEFNTLSFMAGCFRFVKEENTMTWRIVHVCQSEKMQLKLDNLLIKKMGQDYVCLLYTSGSGDTFYDEFCKAVDDFDRVFVATGAEKGSECVKVDLSAEEEDIERLEQFAEELAAKVG